MTMRQWLWHYKNERGKGDRDLEMRIKTVFFCHVGLVQKQTRKVEEAEKVFIRGIRELSKMEQIDQNVRGENRGE